MIKFYKMDNFLILNYTPLNGIEWISQNFEKGESLHIRNTFFLKREDLHKAIEVDNWEEEVNFVIAELNGGYYQFKKETLGLDYTFRIQKDVNINEKMFIATKNISILRKIESVIKTDLSIGDADGDLPTVEFQRLIKTFPNSFELKKYVYHRMNIILNEYFAIEMDYNEDYNNYINKKQLSKEKNQLINIYAEYEFNKYTRILSRLQNMIKSEQSYTEKTWQLEILEILQLLYPKYISVFDEVEICDVYNNKKRRLDYLLIDSNGNIDIAEIKKPSESPIVSMTKYRQNHVPRRDLSGSIMQIEKYIFLLSKWGKVGEEKLTAKYKEHLPENFRVKVTNPSGIVIMGSEQGLSEQQLDDLEIIKRQYKNIMDIMTYEDLIRRLEQVIFKFSKQI